MNDHPPLDERVNRPYVHDKLSEMCRRNALEFDRAQARLSDIMRGFDGTPGVTDYDAWVEQIVAELKRDRARVRSETPEAERELELAIGLVRKVSRPRHDLAPFAMIAGAAQQHVLDLLDSVFYVAFSGKTGSGKGTSVEATLLMTPGGGVVLSGSSPAALAAALEEGLAIGVEELHKLLERDEFIGKLFRDGYRRGPSVALMVPGEGGKGWVRGSRSLFGFKVYDFHVSIDPHLLARTLVFPMVESSDPGLALDAEKKARHLSPIQKWLAARAVEVHRAWTKAQVDELWDTPEFRKAVEELKGKTGRDHVLAATLLLICRLFGWAAYEVRIPDLLETRRSVGDLSDEAEVADAIHLIAGDDPSRDLLVTTSALLEQLNKARDRTGQRRMTARKLGDCLTDLGFLKGKPSDSDASWYKAKEAQYRDQWVISPYRVAHVTHLAQTALGVVSPPIEDATGVPNGPCGPYGPKQVGARTHPTGQIEPAPGDGPVGPDDHLDDPGPDPGDLLGGRPTKADRARAHIERVEREGKM
jgi:hypothetical protein